MFVVTHMRRETAPERWYWRGDGWTRLRGEAKLYRMRKSADAARRNLAKVYYADELQTRDYLSAEMLAL